jgi:hypothetical protein
MDDVESRNAPTELDSDAVQNVGVEFEVTWLLLVSSYLLFLVIFFDES